jgi:2-polyprenyl-3-methyl-5-hydroxy-6-metoxy-1,4-benzoquinol methylase
MTPQYQGETLPPIFHYWSERYVRPLLKRHGFESPEHFYLAKLVEEAARVDGRMRVMSLGSGACSLEIQLVRSLAEQGIDVDFECIDLNEVLMHSAEEAAKSADVDSFMRFLAVDVNRGLEGRSVDVIIVNQFFHHVEDLEAMVSRIRAAIHPHGLVLTSDVIGRNGHLLWPSVEASVQQYWSELPANKRFDRFTNSSPKIYVPENHAAYSNEGIRAQDVVAALLSELDFEVFLTYAGAIVPFVERRIGFNFDPNSAQDCEFIDRVATNDVISIQEGAYPPSNLLGALRLKGAISDKLLDPISPDQYLTAVARELELAIER